MVKVEKSVNFNALLNHCGLELLSGILVTFLRANGYARQDTEFIKKQNLINSLINDITWNQRFVIKKEFVDLRVT